MKFTRLKILWLLIIAVTGVQAARINKNWPIGAYWYYYHTAGIYHLIGQSYDPADCFTDPNTDTFCVHKVLTDFISPPDEIPDWEIDFYYHQPIGLNEDHFFEFF